MTEFEKSLSKTQKIVFKGLCLYLRKTKGIDYENATDVEKRAIESKFLQEIVERKIY